MPGRSSRHARKSGAADRPIPDKIYFKIGEVADLVGVEPHVLRYWEREVPVVRPNKTPSNQRRYRRRDVELFREIRRLLHVDGYTLAGVRRRLMGRQRARSDRPLASAGPPDGSENASTEVRERLARVRAGLEEILRLAGEEP